EKARFDSYRYYNDLKKYNQKITDAINFLTITNNIFLEGFRARAKLELEQEYSGNCDSMSFNSEYPIIGIKNRSKRIIKFDLAERINNAKKSIFIESPYFIVDNESNDVLSNALLKNIEITLLTNSLNSTDVPIVYSAFDNIIKNWLAKGLKAHIFKGYLPENYTFTSSQQNIGRFGLHAKTFVFDNKDVVIGTYNFDPRSANLNAEMTMTCHNNPELAKVVMKDAEDRITGSINLDSNLVVDKAASYETGFLKRLEYSILKIPSSLFDFLL
ncbi:MAG: phospholipase D-like domain-containing protein, partial [Bacteriovorax sp.]|nr:phospholipase D-like domain-containing protein [Bacteriovorax sp.]